jgi:chloramphenicol O-acetyltransferase
VAFGRFRDFGGAGVRVPVGVQVNHMYIDGSDLGDLYEAAAESYARAF